ncbi:MAG: hypothetical protein WBD02_05060 [Acidimicrobiia bacterium]
MTVLHGRRALRNGQLDHWRRARVVDRRRPACVGAAPTGGPLRVLQRGGRASPAGQFVASERAGFGAIVSGPGGPSMSEKVLAALLVVIAVAVIARIAWLLLAPMLGVLIVLAVLVLIYGIIVRRYRGW